MTAKTMVELWELSPTIEVDDYAAGFLMASETSRCTAELKAKYLAQWAARLREYYVEIGREVERNAPKI